MGAAAAALALSHRLAARVGLQRGWLRLALHPYDPA